jgi:hypothetical protein
MIRYLKVLGLALIAVFAMSAAAASSASAVVDRFTCIEQEKCDVTAEGTHTFGTKGSTLTVTCTTEKYTGTLTNGVAGATSLQFTPTYDNCTALGGATTINVNGCTYDLTGHTTTHNKTTTGTETDAPVHITCPGANKIEIKAPMCTISIGAQNGLHGAVYDKQGSGPTQDIKMTTTVDDISYTTFGFGCGLAGLPASGKDGTLTGSVTAKAWLHNSSHVVANHTPLGFDEAIR